MTKLSTEQRDLAAARLREWFPKGSTVHTILRKCSASGMSREIGLVSLACAERVQDGTPVVVARHPNHAAADVLGLKVNKTGDGVKISGAGMDMGFELAYRLGQALYGDGYALKHSWL